MEFGVYKFADILEEAEKTQLKAVALVAGIALHHEDDLVELGRQLTSSNIDLSRLVIY